MTLSISPGEKVSPVKILSVNIPADADGDSLHVEVVVSENDDMSSPDIDAFSGDDTTDWYFDDGSGFKPLPPDGIPGGSQPCTVKYKGTSSLAAGKEYNSRWRVHDGSSYNDPYYKPVRW